MLTALCCLFTSLQNKVSMTYSKDYSSQGLFDFFTLPKLLLLHIPCPLACIPTYLWFPGPLHPHFLCMEHPLPSFLPDWASGWMSPHPWSFPDTSSISKPGSVYPKWCHNILCYVTFHIGLYMWLLNCLPYSLWANQGKTYWEWPLLS